MNRRRVIGALGAIAIALPLVACATAQATTSTPATASLRATTTARATTTGLPIEGYLEAGPGAAKYVTEDASALALLGVDGVNVTSNGSSITAGDSTAASIVATAHARGLRSELLVGNYDDAIGDFSPALATKLFSKQANRKAVISALVAKVAQGKYDGIQLDMESLDASHGAGLATFTAELRSALPRAKSLSMAIMATDTAAGYADEGYQLRSLEKSAGRFVLMAYDQHGPTWTDAGPIGGTPWVRSVTAALVATGVPKAKIDLGVAEYAYTWPKDGTTGEQLSVAAARKLAGKAAHFDATQQEWTATLANGTVLWWSDSRTLASRKILAATDGLHGLAVWELSLGDRLS